MKDQNHSRRKFIRNLGGTAALITAGSLISEASPSEKNLLLSPKKKIASNDKIRIATIGMGIMGHGDTATALQVPGIELVGVCDLYDGRLKHAKELYGNDLLTTRRFEDILARKDIDAVIIATSDNWHQKISIAAMEAGKAVYCEKPMVHYLDEGQQVIDTQKKTNAIFQVGSQRVSSLLYKQAKKLYQAGEIGELNMVEAYISRHSALGAWEYSIPPDASPQTIDFQRFLGDAPKVPFDPVRFFRWRNYKEYGTGIPGDLFVHLISGLHFITDSEGPNRIYSSGGLRYWKDGRNVPDVMLAIFDYPKTKEHPGFQFNLQVNFVDGGESGEGNATRLIGSEGAINIGYSKVTLEKNPFPKAPGYGGWDSYGTFSEEMQQAYKKEYEEKYGNPRPQIQPPDALTYTVPKGYNDQLDHFYTFFDAMRNNGKITEDAVFGFRAAAPALASNKSYFNKKIIDWDPQQMKEVKS